MRRPSLRVRLALVAALAVFVAVTVGGVSAYAVTVRVLSDQIDSSLRDGVGAAPFLVGPRQPGPAPTPTPTPTATAASTPTAAPTDAAGRPQPQPFSPVDLCRRFREDEPRSVPALTVVTVVAPDGSACASATRTRVVVQPADRTVAAAGTGGGLRNGVSSTGERLRVLVRPIGEGYVVLAGRSVAEFETVSSRLRGILALLTLAGALLALGLGFAVARAGLRPVDRLTQAAEEVARTTDLDLRIDVPPSRPDEVTRLAAAFNAMIAALAVARDRQAQLVADAGHELRTPLTSLRTNIDLLVRSDQVGRPLPPAQRQALLASLSAQLEELSELVGELVVLAREEPRSSHVPVRFDAVVDTAVDRARRRAGDRVLVVAQNQPWVLDGDQATLERAVVNLLDNAVKFSPPGSRVTVHQRDGVLQVDDEGPGVPVQDRMAAFDRFWRSDAARSLPGSGLGLAIVADAAASHGGSARLAASGSGGARALLMLPGHPADVEGERGTVEPHRQ